MIPYDPKNLENARQNRRQRNATRQEGVLWHTFLKKCDPRFYRQYRVGIYILDFYCPKRKLAIEIDGGQHYADEGMRYDENRTLSLNEKGITVLRFTNEDIDKNLKGTIEVIRLACRKER